MRGRRELAERRRENRDELAGIRGELGSEIAGLAVGAKRRASGGN